MMRTSQQVILVHRTRTTVARSMAVAWVGSEDLPEYGGLEFRFAGNGLVTMIDPLGAHSGTHTVRGSIITLRFPGRATYTGILGAHEITGTAFDDTRVWNWSVARQ